ncbi:hypothetical protein PF005_g5965 [Phytophthora fragariae]|uniref:Uncharacterized protein n=1 Tax=Phytophthora fragariae TaxID=53985 RepID=A0A6A3FE84_9STRA|nr:hypothetical protein PF009_g6721 [Phytophthora fragariae]KAE9150256.1 hypothetical protein PF006_g5348 [Phytophthora fragariae]KAE9224307.1 hypothetical protein PF005_g5965 [Phytophthora fragariae]
MEHAEMVGIARGYKCSERFKVYKFSQHVRDKAELFFQHHSIRGSTLGYIMEHSKETSNPPQQGNELIVWAQMITGEDKAPKSFGKE